MFVAAGMVQNLSPGTDVTTLAGSDQHITGGPVASQEVIKEFGTNGGGFYNANSAHPFENPTTWTNWFEILLLLPSRSACPGSSAAWSATSPGLRDRGRSWRSWHRQHHCEQLASGCHCGTVPTAVGAATEGTETRFGVRSPRPSPAPRHLTSTGAVDSFHDSYTALGGMVPIANMMLGEVAPGHTVPACTACWCSR